MALGSNHTTSILGATGANTGNSNNFIPELWSDEVIGAYKSNLVVANLVTKMSHKGKKGDSINIPKPNRGNASVKVNNSQVTLIADIADSVQIRINKHYEYSKLIEDIAEVQALASMRKFYTDDAGFALATRVDDDLFIEMEAFQAGTVGGTGAAAWETAVVGGDGTTAYTGNSSNATDITDAGIRKMILKLDDANVPMDSRVLVLPPIASNDLLGLNRFTEQAFVGTGDAIKTGKIGMVYGVDVYVTANCPTVGADRVGALFHKDAIVFAEQVGVRTQTQYKQEYLGDLFTADTIYGTGILRDDAGIAFVVPSS